MSKKEDESRAEVAGVDLTQTVSREPDHSPLPEQEDEDLKAEPVSTLDPVTEEALGL